MLVVALLAFAQCTLLMVVHGLGVPYSLVVLGHDDLVNDKTARIWDSDDSTCFSMPSELNKTMASVRLFLDPPVDLGLVRVVSEPQPNVVYYLLEDNSNGFPTAEKDDLEGNVWIYGGQLSAKVRGVDIHSVTELCEVTIFNISDKIDKLGFGAQCSFSTTSDRWETFVAANFICHSASYGRCSNTGSSTFLEKEKSPLPPCLLRVQATSSETAR
ncbi:uncharacterized protein [Dermacentor albipictus]|uniref:uncharacterized protein isoform X2 n=1 Tax=Dermacentor albipictus TaxID=60249 RepID=UPI0038FCA83A